MWPTFKPKLKKNWSEKFLIISQKKAFHIFQEKELSYILENETFLYFRREIPGLKNEKKKKNTFKLFLIFW